MHEACYLAGCDGARSTTRHRLGMGFEGGTYDQTFYVADVEASGPAADGELHLSWRRRISWRCWPMAGRGRAA
ncbi:FAD-dependent monooxygenase [Pseudoroseomonas wenyumeiae]